MATKNQDIYFRKYAPAAIGPFKNNGELDYKTILDCSYLIYHPYQRRQVWRYFTYMFLHGDELHLALNVIIQFVAGKIIPISG